MFQHLIEEVRIKIDSVNLEGTLTIPQQTKAIVLFVHGSGSSRLSPRNNYVAQILQKENFGTLLFDLLTETEDEIYENRFNINLLSQRLTAATTWFKAKVETKNLAIGYFGASTGAAAALKVAASQGLAIGAVVSRGGRPDLVAAVLPQVRQPTLLIVGGNDQEVLKLNRFAYEKLKSIKKLAVIPGATHLFEEPGALEKVANLAAVWFRKYL